PLPRLGRDHLHAAGGEVWVAARAPARAHRGRGADPGRPRGRRRRGRGGEGVMEAAGATHAAEAHEVHPPEAHRSSRVEPQLLGMLLFIISEVMIFGAFFTALFFIRVVNADPWPAHGHELPVAAPGV